MATIAIGENVYQRAERYAKEHNVSVRTFVEGTIIKAIDAGQAYPGKKFKRKPYEELSPLVRQLIGKGEASKEVMDDLDGRNARMEYLEDKHGEV